MSNFVEIERMLNLIATWEMERDPDDSEGATMEQTLLARAILFLGGERAAKTALRIYARDMTIEDLKVLYDAYHEVTRAIGAEMILAGSPETPETEGQGR